MTSTGKWFISILVDDEQPDPNPVPFTSETTIGIDVGLKDFATFSTGREGCESPVLEELVTTPERVTAACIAKSERIEESTESNSKISPML
ncbi:MULTISPECIES: hypothetical protein [unclassified Methanoculleus]|uniref:hypothetical protein n=1 Tax=unclassified Methanoculleus TaxID=2619537 RepID=UPI0025FB9FE6|nr:MULTISPECIES: hypothetical protein [unclassified Methanoculleus]MDD2787111.1 hypothetical protein [Methanoculleus sp.]MDD4314094.1 hypothetical protein [Methanoculleus sp.]